MELAAFLSFTFAMSFTPGPNNLMALSESRRLGFRGAVPLLWGLFFSFFILNAVSFNCMYSIRAAMPWLELSLKAMGSAYILFLTYQMFVPAEGVLTKSRKGRVF